MNATRQCNKLLEKSPLARWAKQIILARDDAAAAEKIIEGASKKSRDVSESLKRFDVALVSMMLLSLMLFGAILMYGGWGIGWVVYGVLFAIAVDYWLLLRCFKIRGEIETFFEEAPVHLKALRTYIEKYG